MYTSTKDIKANVTTKWNHPNCKFQRGDRVNVRDNVLGYPKAGYHKGQIDIVGRYPGYCSQPIQDKVGQDGHVVAVSCTPDGKIRGKAPNGFYERCFTRYYVQFSDKSIYGIHSHFLDVVE